MEGREWKVGKGGVDDKVVRDSAGYGIVAIGESRRVGRIVLEGGVVRVAEFQIRTLGGRRLG